MDHNNHSSQQIPDDSSVNGQADTQSTNSHLRGPTNGKVAKKYQPTKAGKSNGKSNSVKKIRVKPPKRPKSEQYKRNRTIFNVAQLDALARIFKQNCYPDAPLRKKIAERLEVDEERIQIWFQNRRAKTRRDQRKGNVSIELASSPDEPETPQDLDFVPPFDTQPSTPPVPVSLTQSPATSYHQQDTPASQSETDWTQGTFSEQAETSATPHELHRDASITSSYDGDSQRSMDVSLPENHDPRTIQESFPETTSNNDYYGSGSHIQRSSNIYLPVNHDPRLQENCTETTSSNNDYNNSQRLHVESTQAAVNVSQRYLDNPEPFQSSCAFESSGPLPPQNTVTSSTSSSYPIRQSEMYPSDTILPFQQCNRSQDEANARFEQPLPSYHCHLPTADNSSQYEASTSYQQPSSSFPEPSSNLPTADNSPTTNHSIIRQDEANSRCEQPTPSFHSHLPTADNRSQDEASTSYQQPSSSFPEPSSNLPTADNSPTTNHSIIRQDEASSRYEQPPSPSAQSSFPKPSSNLPTADNSTSTNSYTQHYISAENGHTSRVHVSNAGRSTKGRLRPETQVFTPPPNRVCTAVKDELSQALFRVGLAIGQSAGLQVDTSQLKPPMENEKVADVTQSQTSSNQRPFKKRRHRELRYADSDTSSDSDEEGMSRKRHRRINGALDRGGPPNRVATAVPISDRTLPVPQNAVTSATVSATVPDELVQKTCQELEDEHVDVEALDIESPFSVDILSSPEPKSSPESPFSSSSSLSDWTDLENESAPKPSTLNKFAAKHATSALSAAVKLRLSNQANVKCANRLTNIDSSGLTSRTRHVSDNLSATSCEPKSVDSTASHAEKDDSLSNEDASRNRHRSLSGPVIPQQRSGKTGRLERTEHSKGRRKHKSSHRFSEYEFKRCDISANPYLSSSSSASDENRRNQVSEILTESRQVADCLSSSPVGSPLSESSGALSPASWLFSPRSPLSPMYSYERIRSPYPLPAYTATGSAETHWQPFPMATLPPTTPTPPLPPPSPHYHGYHFSRHLDRPSSSTLYRPVPKFPDIPPPHYHHRPPSVMSPSVYL